MHELPFQVELEWSGAGREGAGRIVTEDLELELSTPASMGGRGVGTNPEELLVCAVASCYAATLFGVLRRAGLPGVLGEHRRAGHRRRVPGAGSIRANRRLADDRRRRPRPRARVRACGRVGPRPLLHRPHDRRQRRLRRRLGSRRTGGGGGKITARAAGAHVHDRNDRGGER